VRSNRPTTRFWHSPAVRQTRQLASPALWYRYWTATRRPLPSFVIAGAQKAGTTSLFGYLSEHPQCAASLTKEVHYFDRSFGHGESWYRMHFPLPAAATGDQRTKRPTVTFESSPYYMFDPRVPERMRQTLPSVKVIFLLRNPVSRAYSHYQHSRRRGREALTFEAAIAAEEARLAGEHERLLHEPEYQSLAHQRYSYLARGIYVDQLRHWQAYFPAEQMLSLQAERMFRQPEQVLQEVLAFLGLDSWTPSHFGNRYAGGYSEPMAADTRERLTHYFAPHNERLFELLGTRYEW
jgi:hypothetical protein